ncbi:hypothetical protein G9A89_004587 [Geosiphon pyriformis]|nr:hypothetical protein G9A89_004587 [Geosiphon pyriformis]
MIKMKPNFFKYFFFIFVISGSRTLHVQTKPIYENSANNLEQNTIPVNYSLEPDTEFPKELDTNNEPLNSYDNQLGFNAGIPDDVAFTPSLSLFNQLDQEFSNTLQPQTVSDNLLMPSIMASLVDEGRESQVSKQPKDSSTFTVENGSNELNQVSFSQDSLPNIAESSFTENETGPVALNFGELKKNLGELYHNFRKDRDLLKNDSKEVRDLGNYALMANAAYCNSGRIPIEYRINQNFNYVEIAVIFASYQSSYDSLMKNYDEFYVPYPKHLDEIKFLQSFGKDKNILVNSEFYQDWLTVQEGFLKKISEMTVGNPLAVIRFIGHGVGGVYAMFASLSYLARYAEKDIAVYTYGQPRMGNGNFRTIIDKIIYHKKGKYQIFRGTRSDDPVVHWPTNYESDPGAPKSSKVKPYTFLHHQTEYFFEEETARVYRCKIPWFKNENESCANGKKLDPKVDKHNGPYFNVTMGQCVPYESPYGMKSTKYFA